MAIKILVSYEGSHAAEWVEGVRKKVADALSVLPEDVVCLPGLSLCVIDVPGEMESRRKKADKEAEKKAADDKAEAEKAEAAEAQRAAREKADRASAEAAGTHSPTAETEHVGRRQKAT